MNASHLIGLLAGWIEEWGDQELAFWFEQQQNLMQDQSPQIAMVLTECLPLHKRFDVTLSFDKRELHSEAQQLAVQKFLNEYPL